MLIPLVPVIIVPVVMRVIYLTYRSWREAQSTKHRRDTNEQFFSWAEDHEDQCIPCSAEGTLLLQRMIYHYCHFNITHGWKPNQEHLGLMQRALHTHTCSPGGRHPQPAIEPRRAQLDGVYAILRLYEDQSGETRSLEEETHCQARFSG